MYTRYTRGVNREQSYSSIVSIRVTLEQRDQLADLARAQDRPLAWVLRKLLEEPLREAHERLQHGE